MEMEPRGNPLSLVRNQRRWSEVSSSMKTTTLVPSSRVFHWRALVSVFLSFGFLALAASGVALFLRPSGRIAREIGSTMLGLDVDQWSRLHIWFAMLFVAGGIGHLVFNWCPMLGYFKSRITRGFALRREWLAALVLAVALAAASISDLPPFRTLADWGHQFRHPAIAGSNENPGHMGNQGSRAGGEKGGGGLGSYGRRTIAETCAQEGVGLSDGLARLRAHGVETDGDTTLREAANQSKGLNPRGLINILRGEGDF